MTDLKEYRETVLVGPSGPRVVHFGADFIFCHRGVSGFQERQAEALAIIRSRCALSPDGLRFGDDWIDNLAQRMVHALDFEKGSTLEHTFREIVLRERPEPALS